MFHFRQLSVLSIAILAACFGVFENRAQGQSLVRTRVTGAASWDNAGTWIQSRTGTITLTAGSTTVTGTGTLFFTEVQPGDAIMLSSAPGTVVGTVASVTNNDTLTLNVGAPVTSFGDWGRQATPGPADSVVIGNPALASPAVTVTMSAADTVGALTLAPATVANSVVQNGHALRVEHGVILNQPTAAVSVIWNIGAGSAYVGGGVTLAGTSTTTTYIRRINLTTGSLNIRGNLTYQQVTSATAVNAIVDVTGPGTIYLGGSLLLTGAATGTLNMAVGSTVVYDGTGPQIVGDGSSIAYRNLTINKTGTDTAFLNASCALSGNFLLQSGIFAPKTIAFSTAASSTWVSNPGTVWVGTTGGITIGGTWTNNGTFRTTTGSITMSGSTWTNNGSFVFTAGGSTPTITFSGGLAQTIGGSSATQAFNNITVNKTAGTALSVAPGVTTITGRAFTLTQGTFNAPPTLDLSSGVTLTAGIFNAGSAVYLKGTWSKAAAATFNAGASTVYFNNTSAQTLGGASTTTFNSLTVVNGVTVTCSTSTNVTGTLTMAHASSVMAPLATVAFNAGAPAGTLTGSGTVRVTRATAGSDFFGQYQFATYTLTGMQVDYNSTSPQAVSPTAYSRLALNGAASTKTAGGDFSVNGTLTFGSATTTLDMGSYVLSGSLPTITGAGILKTACMAAVPLPAGKSWPCNVDYYATTGGQHVMGGTYTKLIISATSGTDTASAALAVSGTLQIGAGGALSMETYPLTGAMTTLSGSGILRTKAATGAIPTGRTWPFAVVYNNPTGGQTIVPGTYAALSTTHSSGTTAPGGAVTVNGAFTHAGAGTFSDGGQTIAAKGDWTVDASGSQAGTGTVIFNGAADQAVRTPGTFHHVTVNKPGGEVLLKGSQVAVGGTLTFMLGRVRADSAVLYSTSGAFSGAGATTGWVVGMLKLPFSATKTTDTFEVGCPTAYSPVSVVLSGVSAGGTLTASATDSLHPLGASSDILPSKMISRYWTLQNSGVVGTSYTATMRWAAADLYGGYDSTHLSATLYAGGSWLLQNLQAAGALYAQVGGLTAFGDLIVGDTCSVTTAVSYLGSPYCSGCGTAYPTHSGTGGGTYSSTPGLSINSATGAVDLSASAPGFYTVSYTLPPDSGCGGYYTVTTPIAIFDSLVWTGATDSNWYVADNWSPARVPTAGSKVHIGCSGGSGACGRLPVIDTGTAPVYSITIDSPATAIVRETGILKIGGAKWGNGRIDAGAGSLAISGTAAQTIPAIAFKGDSLCNLTIANAAGVALAGPLVVTGVLKASAGTLSTSNYLTLASTSARTALVDGSGGGTITGAVTVQRYVPKRRGYHYFGVPATGVTVAQFADEVNLTDTFPRLYYYDEGRLYNGWIKDTTASHGIPAGVGYALNFGADTTPITVDVQGPLVTGTFSFPTLTNHNHAYTRGFNLVANPYPSPLDWSDTAGWMRTGVDNAIYYFNAGSADAFNGTYSSWVAGVSSDGMASPVIPAMQGFFVHVTDGAYPVNGSMIVTNAARRTHPSPLFHRTAATGDEVPLVRVRAAYADPAGLPSDATAVYISDAATAAFHPQADALKMMNTDPQVPNLYSFASGGQRLSVNAAGPAAGAGPHVVPLGLQCARSGAVEFSAATIDYLPEGLHAYLVDARTGVGHDLQRSPAYRTDVEQGTAEARFLLVFSTESIFNLPATGATELLAWAADGEVKFMAGRDGGTAALLDMAGRVVAQTAVAGPGLHSLPVGAAAPGVYIITLQSAAGRVSRKILLDAR